MAKSYRRNGDEEPEQRVCPACKKPQYVNGRNEIMMHTADTDTGVIVCPGSKKGARP
jgi:hypothetical protein